MISFTQKGDFSKTINSLSKMKNSNQKIINVMNRFGNIGVMELSKNTPVDSGLTANSWRYEITDKNGRIKITWYNSNVVNGVPIAIILQYGHATQNGGWVEGVDYINPTMKPIFDNMAKQAWKEVTR